MNLNKYGNQKTVMYGILFDSKREAIRYAELVLLEKGKVISDLQLQVPFLLQEKFVDNQGVKHNSITYVTDFVYIEKGQKIAEDAKGMLTDVYKLKKKLFLYRYPDIILREV